MTITNAAPSRGVVIERTPSTCLVQTGSQYITCNLPNRLRQTNHIVVGDLVVVNEAQQVTDVLPRRNTFSRRRAGRCEDEQVIAANVDQVMIVLAAAQPRLSWNLLDRYLVSAEFAGIPALVCLTKMDLVENSPQAEEIEAVAAEYCAIGYDVYLTSVVKDQGIDELRPSVQNRISTLVGKSGVGKSSLINILEPGLDLRTRQVSSANDKGRHTTTTSRIFPLSSGGFVIDTPGIREFGLWDVTPYDLTSCFPEMRAFHNQCKFGDCAHDEEPGCAVRSAVMDGHISPYRYQSYLKLRDEL